MTVNLSGLGAGAGLLRDARRHLAQWIPQRLRRNGSAASPAEPSYEASLREVLTARGWTFLLCSFCGQVADWVTEGSHACSAVGVSDSDPSGREERGETDCGGLFEEIDEYLTSRDGRYDALVAALIIRSR